jgi:MFS transporter, PPP family, 3-phenylpropionic acid transporter
MLPRKSFATDPFAGYLALFYGGVFLALGVQLPFLPVWLAAKGLDATAIGLVLAAPVAVRLVAVPLVTRAADRNGALRGAIVACAFGSAAGCALLGLSSGFLPILLATLVMSVASTPVMPLIDAYALKGLAGQGYGPVRLWGSATFIVGNLAAGYLAGFIPAIHLIWLIAGAFGCAALIAPLLLPVRSNAPAHPQTPSARALLRSRGVAAVMAAASLVQASHAAYYGFSALAWAAMGLDGITIGALWALGVAAEIMLFWLSGRLPLNPAALLGLGAAGAAIRWTCMAFDPPAIMLPGLQCLHALSFGATHLGAVQYLARAAPENSGATAQGYFSVVQGVAMALAMVGTGVLFSTYGSLAYLPMAAAAVLGGALLVRLPAVTKTET